MRAEAQQYIDRIDAALDLLRRFLDWDRCLLYTSPSPRDS